MSGVPVIVAGQTHYRGKGFTLDPDTWEALPAVLEQMLAEPKAFRLTRQQVDQAWNYAYRFFFEYPQPFPWHLLHFWNELEEWPVERVLSKEGQAIYGNTFRYLLGEPIDWKSKLQRPLMTAALPQNLPALSPQAAAHPPERTVTKKMAETATTPPDVKQQVREFYDQVGWQQVDAGLYQNARYEDLRPVSQEYIHRCHLRVGRHLRTKGDYLLDAGSGPIQYPEYLEYSHGYNYRVCADISIVALQEARERIGSHGLFVVADIADCRSSRTPSRGSSRCTRSTISPKTSI